MTPATLLAVSLVAEYCNATTLRKLRCLSREVLEAFDNLPFSELMLGRWARGNTAVIADLRHYSNPLWKILVATSDSDDDNIEQHETIMSLDGRRYMLRASICDILNFMTTSTINIPLALGYRCCDVIKLSTCMNEDDLTLKIYLFPVKDPELRLTIKLYAATNSSNEPSSENEPPSVQVSDPSNWPFSPVHRRIRPNPIPIESKYSTQGVNFEAKIEKGAALTGAFIWRPFVPAFKRIYKHFTNGDGKCYLEIILN